jgi:hypothetical protein
MPATKGSALVLEELRGTGSGLPVLVV